jgi:hypothetical protein
LNVFKYLVEEAAVDAIVIYLLYLAIGIGLVAVVGQALARSGRAFLAQPADGRDSAAGAASRLLVVAFYLVSLGFVALTAPTGARTAGAGQALVLLSGRVGLLLLGLGVLHVTGTLVLARMRRGRGWQPAGTGTAGTGTAGTGTYGGGTYGGGTFSGRTAGDEMAGDDPIDGSRPGGGAFGGGTSGGGAFGGGASGGGAADGSGGLAAPTVWRPRRVVH